MGSIPGHQVLGHLILGYSIFLPHYGSQFTKIKSTDVVPMSLSGTIIGNFLADTDATFISSHQESLLEMGSFSLNFERYVNGTSTAAPSVKSEFTAIANSRCSPDTLKSKH